MPNRERVIENMVDDVVGYHQWRWIKGVREHVCQEKCSLPPSSAGAEARLAEEYAKADALFVKVIEGMDWNRVLLIATDRHQQALEHDLDHVDCADLYGEQGVTEIGIRKMPCGDCVTEAALYLAYAQFHWALKPTEQSPRARPASDFERRLL